ncbi:MAG TPA: cytochrome c [Burkholderiaceae bacterium]|nr:cytochrome c [Burkholderiaceae bacterium]
MVTTRGPMRGSTRRVLAATLAATLAASTTAAHADGSAKAGRAKAKTCEACHGLDGVSKIPEAPNLAGQVEAYLVEQLNSFKSGARSNAMMSVIGPTLSPQDIADLAAYYSSIEITVGKVPGE